VSQYSFERDTFTYLLNKLVKLKLVILGYFLYYYLIIVMCFQYFWRLQSSKKQPAKHKAGVWLNALGTLVLT